MRTPSHSVQLPSGHLFDPARPRSDGPLNDEELAALDAYTHAALYAGDRGAVLRDLFFSWWEERFVSSPNGAPTVGAPSPSSSSTTAEKAST